MYPVFLISGKQFELKLSQEQYYLIDPILNSYEEMKFKMDSNISLQMNLENTSKQILAIINKLVTEREMLKLLSYILVEKSKEFSIDDAKKNEKILDNICVFDLIKVFGNFLALYRLKDGNTILMN
jgi:hypothetical protein